MRLVPGDPRERIAEKQLMVKVDPGQHRGLGASDRGGVQPAPQADFQHRHLHAGAHEVVEGQRGGGFEDRGVEPREEGAESVHPVGQVILGDAAAVHPDALAQGAEMRGRIESRPDAVGLEHGRHHGRGGALAIGAADLDQPHPALGIADGVEQALDRLQPRPHARHLPASQREEPGHGFAIRHGAGWTGPVPKKARMRRSVSRSSRRSTTMSS
jgi:hypothetical protein